MSFLVNILLKIHNHMRDLMGKFYLKILKIFGKVMNVNAPPPPAPYNPYRSR